MATVTKRQKVLLILKLIDDSQNNIDLMNLLKRDTSFDEEIIMIAPLFLFLREDHVRVEQFYEIWINQYLEYDFFNLFRMSRETFYSLLNKIDCPELNKKYTGGNEPIAAEKQLLMTLWWLGKGEVLLSVSERFNVAISTVLQCTEFILLKLINLINDYVVWPDSNEIIKIENDFRLRSGYPGVIGAVDGCNIPFKAPLHHQEDYIDRKLQHSIKLQAICTADKTFTHIFVGFPGSAHDARVLRNSSIYSEVEENNNYQKYFPNDQYHIVGDSAYPLLNWLMTPYRNNGRLNQIERRHNVSHSVTRIVVEHSFGLLKSRWRILKYINVNSIEKAIRVITACCVLHNFCYVHSDIWEEYEPVDPDENDDMAIQIRQLNRQSERKRNNIALSL